MTASVLTPWGRAFTWMLLVVFWAGCASSPAVLLRTGDGRVRRFASANRERPPPIRAAEFEDALSRLVLDLPLTVRPSRLVRTVSGEGARRDRAFLMHDRYSRWCRAHQAPGDCLSLLEDGAGFSEMDRLTFAVGMSLEPLRASIGEALRDTVNPALFVSVVAGALTSWVVLAAAPEPVFTKAAAVLAAVMLLYLGVQSFLTVVRACGTLKDATDRATTFQELEEAGERFGQTLGPEVARLFVLAVTVVVSHGVTVGLSSALTLLPGGTEASMLGASHGSLRLLAVQDVSAVAVMGETVEVTLASTAVAMSAMGPPAGGGLPLGGPGKWVQVTESMSERARAYQAQVTGTPEGQAYRVEGVGERADFDGFDATEPLLLDAKGPGYEKFLDGVQGFKRYFRGDIRVLEQARRQLRCAKGIPVRWIVAEERFAVMLRKMFARESIDIEVVLRPAAP
ncbi:SitA5 family polymorphic toxin [Corallococcus llansteffanensis]|uniref:Tox-REase-5 domain-containing protein n=1 Tax=Corallococcus llansteffanensis TaxID=2316731 RepID=A0A3A8QL84_9BACT|nr:Tox-REase-5 domain-containing protein [Corallococcus llansteffanensis]RKH63924.1 hypothetical protein D7V93_08160 [Corallococcus llansteffanensis]